MANTDNATSNITDKSPAALAHRAIEDLALEAENSVEQMLRLVDRLHKGETPVAEPPPAVELQAERAPEVAEILRLNWDNCLETFSILHPKCKKEYLEQFRRLRSRLTLAQKEWQANGAPLQVVSILSASPLDGKSFVAANLAAALALGNEQRVLVIDANPITQSLTSRLGVDKGAGLKEAMRGAELEYSLRQAGETNLYFMPAIGGGANVFGGIDLRQLPELLERLRADFQWIILDAPASEDSSDAELLGSFADGTILVLRKGLTPFKDVAKIIENVPVGRVVGAVFNNE